MKMQILRHIEGKVESLNHLCFILFILTTRILAFAACADISTEKIEAMIRSGVTKDAALQRASRYFRHEKVINR